MDDIMPYSKLKARCKAAGMSVSELARRAGVNRSTFARWGQGLYRPSHQNYIRIIAALDNRPMPRRRPKKSHARAVATVDQPSTPV